MSSFFDFCSERGLILEHLSSRRWARTKTVDHPRKRNGAYYYDGDFGHVQNWATMDKTETWFADKESKGVDPDMVRRMEESRVAHDRRREEDAIRAEQKAAEMIAAATVYEHPYLADKGLPRVKGLVLDQTRFVIDQSRLVVHHTAQTLLVPMRTLAGRLVGLQTIEMEAGEWKKKMLFGTRAKGAVHRLGRGSKSILCEGYATGLSIDAALRMSPGGESVVVCFSAGNLVHVAGQMPPGTTVFADNDLSRAGQEAAEKSGCPWMMSDQIGEDANDLMVRSGLMAVASKVFALRRLSQNARQASKVTAGAIL